MSREILLSATPFGLRAAIIEDGTVVALRIESSLRPSLVGDVFLGRIVRPMPALGGAFVALSGGIEGWLESATRLTSGQTVGAQVLSDARGRKGPRLTLMPEAPSPPAGVSAPCRVAEAGGLLGRLLTDHGEGARVFCDDAPTAARLVRLAERLDERARPSIEAVDDADLFERHDSAGAFEAALAPVIALEGGRLTIEETEALVAIDVDLSGRSPQEASLTALDTAARAIIQRNLAGIIAIDLPRFRSRGLAARQRAVLETAFAHDPAHVTLHERSAVGLIELTRQRRGESTTEALTERANPGAARAPRLDALAFDLAYAARRVVRSSRKRRFLVRASPRLIALLERDGAERLSAWLGAAIELRPSDISAITGFEIEAR